MNIQKQSLPVIIAGATGRMGTILLQLVRDDSELSLHAAIEHPDSPHINESVNEIVDGFGDTAPRISDQLPNEVKEGAIVIDFTRPEATRNFLKTAKNLDLKMVIGTTGLTQEDHQLINKVSKSTSVVQAPNMSVGVNLLKSLAGQATETLGSDFDVEILEMHHRHKEDAPSGTALMLGEEIADTKNLQFENVKVTGRKGFTGERDTDEIAILSLRGGDVVGDHKIIFAGEGERIELTHKASSRETFGRGALRAAKFLSEKNNGRFTMEDVLEL